MAANLNVDTKQQILEGTFAYLVRCGLENFSIRDLVKQISITEGTIYYWYKNKDELICMAAEYGLRRISDRIFRNFYRDCPDIEKFFNTCLIYIDEVKKDLRFIYQVASSPVYGEILHNSNSRFRSTYNEYAKKLTELSNGDYNEIRPIIYSFASTIVDYAIWQDSEETQIQLDYYCKKLKIAMNIKEDTITD
ncbi:MAG: TetR/AcrR family transcriptional regulator [Clostridia bacterium]|nr:TetR/AcrR family transcriptional regulator [Clostridia bacterium]